jgi:hypothetical protein
MFEAIATSLRDLLVAELPAQIDALNADRADDIVLDHIKDVIIGERLALNWPALWVHVDRSRVPSDRPDMRQLGLEGVGDWVYMASVAIAVTDPDNPDNLRLRLYRYAEALALIVREHMYHQTGWYFALGMDISLSTAGWVRQSLWRQDVQLQVEIHRAD